MREAGTPTGHWEGSSGARGEAAPGLCSNPSFPRKPASFPEGERRFKHREIENRWKEADLSAPLAWRGSIPLFCRLEADGYVAAGVGTCKRGLKSSRGVLCGKILPHPRSSRFLALLQKSSCPCLGEGHPPTPLNRTAACHACAARGVHGGGGGGIPGFSRRHSASQPRESGALTEPNLGRPGERTALFWGSWDRSRARPSHGGGGGRRPFPLVWIVSLT